MPTKTGMSFIYMQHLSPDYKSVLVKLLSRVTSMKVIEAKNSMSINLNTVYTIPAGKEKIVSGRYIKLSPRKKNRSSFLSIDSLFQFVSRNYAIQCIPSKKDSKNFIVSSLRGTKQSQTNA